MRVCLGSLLGILLFGFSLPVPAQQVPGLVSEKVEKVYVSVEQMPEFAGGQDSLMAFIGRHINYPAEAIQNQQQGSVIVSFVVDATGKVIEPKVLRSAAPSLDAEAIRVLNNLPLWKPGKQNGQAVAVKINLPIRFRLAPEQTLAPTTAPQDSVVFIADEPPSYPGGEGAMMAFLYNNIKYPKEALEKKVEGLSVISFVIDHDGRMGNFRVLQRLGWGTDDEAIRVLRRMPKWKPAKQKGQPVKVMYTLPVRFSI